MAFGARAGGAGERAPILRGPAGCANDAFRMFSTAFGPGARAVRRVIDCCFPFSRGMAWPPVCWPRNRSGLAGGEITAIRAGFGPGPGLLGGHMACDDCRCLRGQATGPGCAWDMGMATPSRPGIQASGDTSADALLIRQQVGAEAHLPFSPAAAQSAALAPATRKTTGKWLEMR